MKQTGLSTHWKYEWPFHRSAPLFFEFLQHWGTLTGERCNGTPTQNLQRRHRSHQMSEIIPLSQDRWSVQQKLDSSGPWMLGRPRISSLRTSELPPTIHSFKSNMSFWQFLIHFVDIKQKTVLVLKYDAKLTRLNLKESFFSCFLKYSKSCENS